MFVLSLSTSIDTTPVQNTSPTRTHKTTTFLMRTPLPKQPRALPITDTITLGRPLLRKTSTPPFHAMRRAKRRSLLLRCPNWKTLWKHPGELLLWELVGTLVGPTKSLGVRISSTQVRGKFGIFCCLDISKVISTVSLSPLQTVAQAFL